MDPRVQTIWARSFLDALVRRGVQDVVVSPGSRSTPLVCAAVSNPKLRTHVVIDERSAAFFALGQARVTGRPSVLICTSGTAGAHYYPAVIEAAEARLPLIVVTADRPVSLQASMANQTIDQLKLFSDHVRAFFDLGEASEEPSSVSALERMAAQAWVASTHPDPGPVHLNFRAKKPLEPDVEALGGAPRGEPIAIHFPELRLSSESMNDLAQAIDRAQRGIIVAGPSDLSNAKARSAVFSFAARASFAVLPEATSQLRFVGGDFPDGLLLAPALLESIPNLGADLIIQLGRPPTYAAYPESDCELMVFSEHGWADPTGRATMMIKAPAAAVLSELAERIAEPSEQRAAYLRLLEARNTEALSRLEAKDRESEVAQAVVSQLPKGSILVIGNSRLVRRLDRFVTRTDVDLLVASQRGASGIDGFISGSAGSASVADRPVTLLCGDLAFLHDLNGLEIARRHKVTMIVVNNDGGRIFEDLPIWQRPLPGAIRQAFTTPHGLGFEDAARMFEIDYARVRAIGELSEALVAARQSERSHLIEIL